MTEKLGETCIDGGECHHKCKEKCFRRECCSPFIDYQGPWAYDEEFKLERRYFVFKIADLGNSLKGDEIRKLADEYDKHRIESGKEPLVGVFIEQDWPEFAPVLRMLERRATQKLVVTRSPDANVERNRELLLQRSIAGLAKYGVTTERNDLTLSQWLQHALEEVLDLANYLQAAKAQIERDAQLVREAFEEGFRMRGQLDPNSPNGCAWRSAEEAWLNSDVEEKVTR